MSDIRLPGMLYRSDVYALLRAGVEKNGLRLSYDVLRLILEFVGVDMLVIRAFSIESSYGTVRVYRFEAFFTDEKGAASIGSSVIDRWEIRYRSEEDLSAWIVTPSNRYHQNPPFIRVNSWLAVPYYTYQISDHDRHPTPRFGIP